MVSSRVMGGVAAVVMLAIAGAFLVKDAGTQAIFVIIGVGVLAAIAVYWVGQGEGGDDSGLAQAIRRAREGTAPKAPEGASEETQRVYEVLAAIADDVPRLAAGDKLSHEIRRRRATPP